MNTDNRKYQTLPQLYFDWVSVRIANHLTVSVWVSGLVIFCNSSS